MHVARPDIYSGGRKLTIVLLVALSCFILSPGRAAADAWEDAITQWEQWTTTVYRGTDCDKYAAQAQQDQFLSERLHCAAAKPADYSGPRWQENINAHASWCRAHGSEPANDFPLNSSAMQHEEGVRQDYLGTCFTCSFVAKAAIDQAKTATALHCGFTGAEWSAGLINQMRACFVNSYNAFNRLNAHDDEIKACRISARSRLGGSPPTGGPPPRIPPRP